jgi:hypothetical protein
MKKIIYFYLLPTLFAFAVASLFLWDTESYLPEQVVWLSLLIYLIIRLVIDKRKILTVFVSILAVITVFYIGLMWSDYCGFDYGCNLEHSDRSGLFGLFFR